jgi:alpha-tubulin suppressor-like RCC1 family protein
MMVPLKTYSQTYSLYVGERKTLPTPTPPAGTIDATYYECTNKSDCIGVAGSKIYVHHYFTGTATIECTYNYSYISSYTHKRVVDSGTKTYYVTCNATTVKLNKSELTMEIGDEFQFKYETSPSGLEPLIEWVSSDKNIADFYGSSDPGLLYASKAGTCTITAKCNSGMPDPKCTITVVDNYWVKTDIPSGTVAKGTQVTLTSTKSGATIYYTTDGTDPTKKSNKYSKPIVINESVTLKAKAYLGSEESKITKREYTVVAHAAGEVFTHKTIEGVTLQYKAFTKGSDIYLQVGTGEKGKPAIDKNYTGHVTIPSSIDGMSVRQIGEYAFERCKLSSASLISRISSYAFSGCENLVQISLPFGTDLMPWAFANCKSLRTVISESLPYFTNSFSYYASASNVFAGCDGIKRIYIRNYDGSPKKIKDDVFPQSVYNGATLYVDESVISKFKKTDGWKKFSNIASLSQAEESQVQLTSSLLGNFAVEKGVKVMLSSPNAANAEIYYTTDGTTPTASSHKYKSSGITINDKCVLKCIAYGDGYEESNILLSGVYEIRKGTTSALKDVKQVSAAQYHTMVLLSDGSLWVCGDNSDGLLGDGTTTQRITPQKMMDDVNFISAGLDFSLIVKKDRSLWACGDNYYGQLGDGTKEDKTIPVKIMDGVASVAAGGYHSLILKDDGTLWVCGKNNYGQLGDGTKTECNTPKKIMNDVASVSAGWDHSLVVKTDRSLWAFGYNNGKLGDGTKTNRLTPKKIMDDVASASAGMYHSLIVKTDGSLWACGNNSYGQLGDGTNTEQTTPKKIMDDVVSVSAKYNHSFIIKSDGSLWVCGNNSYGQLGDGTTQNCTSPKKIMDGVADASTGRVHSLIVKTDKSLWTCGSNWFGRLFDGTEWNSATPIMTIGSSSPSSVDSPQIFIRQEASGTYNLYGQKLTTPKKGINIINGKKVVIK